MNVVASRADAGKGGVMTRSSRYRVNGISLAVSTRTSRRPLYPPVVLLAGTGSTAADWDTVAEALSRERNVHAVDLRGHGRSDWPGQYSIDLMAADVMALLPELSTTVDVIGHSLGGLVAARALSLDPLIGRRLVLEDVGLPHPRRAALLTRPDGELDFDWEVIEQVRPEIDRPAPHWRYTFTRITAPTLVIGGGSTSFVPQAHVAELADLLHEGRHVTIEAGHCVHAREADRFVHAVLTFLGDHSAA